MQTKNQLGNGISYKDIKNSVRQKQPLEFTAKASQVNLDNPDIQEFIEQQQPVQFPPLLNKEDIFCALWVMSTTKDSQKWDYIVLLTYLNDGHIAYDKIKSNRYLVTIKF